MILKADEKVKDNGSDETVKIKSVSCSSINKGMSKQFKRFKDAAKDFIFGMTTYDYTVELKHKMFQHECILETVIFGDPFNIVSIH